MTQKLMAYSRSVAIASDQSTIPVQVVSGSVTDRELVVTTYIVRTAFTGASVGDTVTCTQIIDTSTTPTTISTIWRNQTTAADFGSVPSASNLTLLGSSALTDAQLRASAFSVIKGQQLTADCTILSGASLSAGVDLGIYRLVGLSIPATFEPTTVTFQSSFDNVTWNNVFDSTGVERTITTGASRRIVLSPADFYGIRYIRVRGGTAASPTTVAADRTIKLIAEG